MSKFNKKRYLAPMIMACLVGSMWSVSGVSYGATQYHLDDMVISGDREKVVEPVVEETQPEATYGGGQVTKTNSLGALGNRANIDTPFNVTGYTAQLIEDRQMQSVDDVVLTDASVSNATDMSANKTWTIRGISQSAEDTSFNGMFGAGPIYGESLDNIASVEVLKGPAALLNGLAPNGSVGGSVNLVPKRAEDTPTRKFTIGVDNGHQWRQHLDVGQRFGNKNKYGVRLNVSHKSGSGKLNGEHYNGNNAAIGFDVRGNTYRASVDMGYTNTNKENFAAPLRIDHTYIPAVPSMNTKFSADGAFIHSIEKYMAVKSEYDLNKDWTLYGGFGFRTSSQESYTSTLTFMNQASPTTTNVNAAAAAKTGHANSQMIGIRGKAKTGGITHEINVVGNRYNSTFASLPGVAQRYWTNPFNPTWQTLTGLLRAKNLNKTAHTYMSGLAITDVLSTKNNKWQFIVGARYQKIASQNFNRTTGAETSSYSSSAWSPAFGIVHKFNDKFAMYGNYIEGLQPGIMVPYNDGNLNEGQVFAPYKTKQKEVGFKYDSGKYAATISAFTVDLPSYGYVRFSPAIGGYSWRYEQTATTRNRGIELNVYGEPKKGTRVLGSMMFLDAKLKNTRSAATQGKQDAGRSRFTAVLGVEQDIKGVKGLSVNATATYNSKAYINQQNTLSVSPWIRWDIGAKYEFTAGKIPLTLRADVFNVFNHNHWEAAGYRIYQGKGRTLAVSLTTEF